MRSSLYISSIFFIFIFCFSVLFSQVGNTDNIKKNKTEQDTTNHDTKDTLQFKTADIKVSENKLNSFGIKRLLPVENSGIFAGKKTEVVIMESVTGNLATNNPRQVFSKITGINIWESDAVGLQLGIGGRGLNPSRVSNFNTRQNGYDMSADALGYPESYYTPPTESLEKIEVVRGAASLQYGTQFGGFINFQIKEGNSDKLYDISTRQTVGSYGLFNTFNSIGGKIGDIQYYAFYNQNMGDSWRENSKFDSFTYYGKAKYYVTENLSLSTEFTKMKYDTQQAGGLTDELFNDYDPRKSYRDGNYFKVDWNLLAFIVDYKFNSMIKLNSKNFLLDAQRTALGNLDPMIGNGSNSNDFSKREIIDGQYFNYGNETRLFYNYIYDENKVNTLLVGSRVYIGNTLQKQGDGFTGTDQNYTFKNPDSSLASNYVFPSTNLSLFAEHIFNFSENFSVTPGVRFEYIKTNANGYFIDNYYDLAGNLTKSFKKNENLNNERKFVLLGLGVSYWSSNELEIYSNLSQNFRAINFSDIKTVNQNFVVDENLKDESGMSADLGLRGQIADYLYYDLNLFGLYYYDKIGSYIHPDYGGNKYRTNISDSRTIGIEGLIEFNILSLISSNFSNKLSYFINFSFLDSRYVNSDNPAIEFNDVENAPNTIIKTGLNMNYERFKFSFQYSYTSSNFTDATNSILTPEAFFGLVPAYDVFDISFEYDFSYFKIMSGFNNMFDNKYFTRRSESYPGPGIIPADGRTFYFTFELNY